MKSDIDKLMNRLKIDAIYAEGSSNSDATMYYLLNGANVSGRYIKRRGRPAWLVHSSIERGEAAKSGLKLINIAKYNFREISERYKDRIKANAFITKTILDDLKIRGNVVFYGMGSLGRGYHYLRQVAKFDKNIKIYYEPKKSLIAQARETKDEQEIKRIKRARNGVIMAFNQLLKTVRGMKLWHNIIMKDRKRKLTIGDMKDILARELFNRGFVNSVGLIVSQGRDAGIPHNAGRDHQPVKIGKTIVFDIYPQEIGGGYFFDFTRTICFGSAPKEIREVYKIVSDAQDYIIDSLRVGERTRNYERRLCRFFEKWGHPTFLSKPGTQIGYCHSLGHGVGLNIHESPYFGLLKTIADRIQPGSVFTVEPGLYYPDKNFGVRLEDVVYVNKKGKIENLTKCPKRLVVKI